MPTFDPKQTASSWGPIRMQGVMDGEFAGAERQENAVDLHVGSQGFATFVFNANESGTFKITLSQESPTNRELSIAHNARVIAPFQLEDLNDGTLVIGVNTAIQKHAPVKRGNKIIGMEWTFITDQMVMQAGGDQ